MAVWARAPTQAGARLETHQQGISVPATTWAFQRQITLPRPAHALPHVPVTWEMKARNSGE